MGMFDSVKGKCPHCNKEIELQSKAGKCSLGVYDLNNVPITIANDLDREYDDYSNQCDHCGEKFVLITHNMPKFVQCSFVKYSEELIDQKEKEREESDGASYDHLDDDWD